MIRSMTGFASATGSLAPYVWSWELRAVNSKGQDLRLRVPDWIEGLEAALRRLLTGEIARGAITLSLRVTRDESAASAIRLNRPLLDEALAAITEVERRAEAAGVTLAPTRAADLLMLRGMLEGAEPTEDHDRLKAALLEQAATLVADFNAMRCAEGRALFGMLDGQITEIEHLRAEARALAPERAAHQKKTIVRNLALVMENSEGAEPDRVAQELALIAVKSDVTEEIDRLGAHVIAARQLLDEGGPVGRKLDFLMQEFNRETNTLCSKAQHQELTRCGLSLKAVIDQMREQVQNVE